MSARASQLLLLRGPPPAGGSFPRRLFAAFHDPFGTSYPQNPDQQREPRVQNVMATSVEAGMGVGAAPSASAAPSPFGHPSAGGCEALPGTPPPLGAPPMGSNAFDPTQGPPGPYGQYTVGDAGAPAAGLQEAAAYGAGGLPYAYGFAMAPFPAYQAASFYGPPPGLGGGVGYYPPMGAWPVQQGAPPSQSNGVASPFPAPFLQQPPNQGPWPNGSGGTASWNSPEARGPIPRANGMGNEGAGAPPPTLSARERQRQFLSAALLGELDALEAKKSVLTYLEGLNGGKLGGRMGPKEWLYTTNVLSDLLRSESHEQADFGVLLLQQLLVLQQLRQLLRAGRSSFLPHDVALLAANASRVQALFSMHFLSREAGKKAADALANPSASLRQALRAAATAGGEEAGETQGPLSLTAYKTACDELVAEVVFCCAKKIEEYPASTQPSYVRSLPTIMRAAPAQLLPKDNHHHQLQQQQQQQQQQQAGAAYTVKGVKAVWTELVLRVCPLLGRFEYIQLLQILQGASALANRKVIRDNDLLTLTQGFFQVVFGYECTFCFRAPCRLESYTPVQVECQMMRRRRRSLVSPSTALIHRLCWALCALRAFDPEVAAGSWSAAEAATLLQSALNKVDIDNVASLALLPEALTEIKLSADLLPNFSVPAAVEAAAGEASRVQAAVDRRQSRRLHFTFRRALEKLGAHVHPASSLDQKIEFGEKDESKLEQENSFPIEEETKELHANSQIKGGNQASAAAADTADQWFYNEELGPYNVSFYCPAKKVALEIDDRYLGRESSPRIEASETAGSFLVRSMEGGNPVVVFGVSYPSKYVKKRHLEKLFEAEGLRVLVVGEHLFQLSRVTGEQGIDLLRSAISSPGGAEEVCPSRHVQLQALLKSFPRHKAKVEEGEMGSAPAAAATAADQ
ncbi:hypothetical protein ACSSS7_003425 [Eimeria intestinalis]